MSPSRIAGSIECPATRSKLVYPGLGHQPGGVPMVSDEEILRKLLRLSPAVPWVPATAFSRGRPTTSELFSARGGCPSAVSILRRTICGPFLAREDPPSASTILEA